MANNPSNVLVGTVDIYHRAYAAAADPVNGTQTISWIGWTKAGYKTKETGLTITPSEEWFDKEVEEHNAPIDSELVGESCMVEFELAESDAEQLAHYLLGGSYSAWDDTILRGAINDTVTTIPVEHVNEFLTAGTIQIDDEQITYSGVDTTNQTFTGATRGANGSSNVSHLDEAGVKAITALSGAIDNSVTIIPVDSVDHAPSEGTIKINDEEITYTTVDTVGETFGTAGTGAARGANSTTPAAHSDDDPVDGIQSNVLGIGDKAAPTLLSFAFAGKGPDSTDAQGLVWFLPKIRSDGDRGITFHKAKNRSVKVTMQALIDTTRSAGERLAKVFEITTA